ncbi:MAG TPA: PspC domain-containing protein [Acidimicrobiales bacterium]|nr:PspC domain-containing protein [Acidimicrobiales bacterium]
MNIASETAPSEPAGAASGSSVPASRRPERLHRSRNHRMVAGVADGLAEYFDIDTTLVRVGFVALTLFGGLAVPLYLAGWLLIPEEGSDCSVAEDFLGHHPAV